MNESRHNVLKLKLHYPYDTGEVIIEQTDIADEICVRLISNNGNLIDQEIIKAERLYWWIEARADW